MQFKKLETQQQLEEIKGTKGYTVIFKHNTTCPISKNAKSTLEGGIEKFPEETSLFILDLLQHRDVSDAIAEQFNVVHQSPQLLLIKDGVTTFDSALFNINVEETVAKIV